MKIRQITVLTALFSFLLLTSGTCSSEPMQKEIQTTQLPVRALKFISKYFPEEHIKKAEIEKRASLTQYKVKVSGGNTLQFNQHGQCTHVWCKNVPVPEGIVPAKIAESVAKEFPDCTVQEIEHDGKLYELVLSNGWEATYNGTYRLIDLDKEP